MIQVYHCISTCLVLNKVPPEQSSCSGIAYFPSLFSFFFLIQIHPSGRNSLPSCGKCFHSGELVFPPQGIQAPPGQFRSHFFDVLWWRQSSLRWITRLAIRAEITSFCQKRRKEFALVERRLSSERIYSVRSKTFQSRSLFDILLRVSCLYDRFLKCYIPRPE